MERPYAKGFDFITEYAPARIATRGVVRLVFGLLIGGIGALAFWVTRPGSVHPAIPELLIIPVGAALVFAGLSFVSGAVGRITSAFARFCYICAGPAGIAFYMPRQGWFGNFQMVYCNFTWNEIERLVHFTRSVILIPVSAELRIELCDGETVSIPRHYFAVSSKEICNQLSAYCTVDEQIIAFLS